MAQSAGEPISREKFLDVVWGYAAFPTTRTVDNHIASLRGKIERNPDAQMDQDRAWRGLQTGIYKSMTISGALIIQSNA